MRYRPSLPWTTTSILLLLAAAISTVSLSSVTAGNAMPQEPGSMEPAATTGRFVFYSRFSLNLVDGLRRATLGVEESSPECLQALSAADRNAWARAMDGYRELFIDADDGRRRAIFLRLNLAGLGDRVRGGLEPTSEKVERVLEEGSPAYRACWWERDDEANRRWIENLAPMLHEVGDSIAERLAAAYQTPWHEGEIPVDVVGYVSRQGAHTIRPAHVLVSSTDPDHQGPAGLEIVFHEASHTIFGPRRGEPMRRVHEAAERLDVDVPDDLWHVLLFYTTGEVVRRVIEETWGEPYDPYLYATGLFEGAWPELREPVEDWWQPYLDGELSMSEAADGMLRALPDDRGERP